MLNITLNTNEVKNSSGTEVEFTSMDSSGRTREFQQIAETPNLRHRLQIAHREAGSAEDNRRQSKIGIFKEVTGASGKKRVVRCNLTIDAPVGDLSSDTEIKNVIAEVLSFCATTGAGTTVLFDCSGNGASLLVSGALGN